VPLCASGWFVIAPNTEIGFAVNAAMGYGFWRDTQLSMV
jgi:hypothetical protein